MDKRIVLSLIVFSVIFFVSSAFAQGDMAKMVGLPSVEDCLSGNYLAGSDEQTCLQNVYPKSSESCEKIPEKYGVELREKCYSSGFFCDKIFSAELKQQCTEAKAKKQFDKNWINFWNIIQSIVIPLAIIAVILSGLIDFSRKKLGKKGILIRIALIVFLAMAWAIIVDFFCFNCIY